MDLFDTTLKNELGDDYEDLLQIIDDYLERPRRSELSVVNTAEKIYERVEQATSDIESASQYIPEPTANQAEASNSSQASQSPKTEESPQTSESKLLQSSTTAARTPTIIAKTPTATKPPDDDDVVYVSSEPSARPVIDLLTPNFNFGRRRNRRRRPIEVITLDDSWPESEPPKRLNTTVACTKVEIRPPADFESSPTDSKDSGLKLKCAVCMDDPIKKEPTTTICGHIFCKKCIFRAIKISKKCPLCNKKINSTSQVHRVYV